MINNSNDLELLSVEEIFKKYKYVIPIYQRDYAWTEKEIKQLLLDIIDSTPLAPSDQNARDYYLGTLVVHEKEEGEFEVIDGQQRLTTLYILLCYLANENKHKIDDISETLLFESREKSSDSLKSLFKNDINITNNDNPIFNGYNIIKSSFINSLNDAEHKREENDVTNFLFNHVKILMVKVPKDTDLNHYFEIMNSRGEQLEEHEVIKANCMSELDGTDQYLFGLIWDACSDMNHYVQFGFNADLRAKIFGNSGDSKWNSFKAKDENELFYMYLEENKPESPNNEGISIGGDSHTSVEDILNYSVEHNGTDDIGKEKCRFNSVIDFPNFLLQVLKIFAFDNNLIKLGEPFSLDDKKLQSNFNDYLINKADAKAKIKRFAWYLPKARFIFDKYIIKREYINNTDKWSLKEIHFYNDKQSYRTIFLDQSEDDDALNKNSEHIIMLESMFHVSTPTMIYKHWLNGCLKYLLNKESINAAQFISFLQSMARCFMFDHYIYNVDFDKIIYENDCKLTNTSVKIEVLNENLDKGVQVENFCFNYLDYILWSQCNKVIKDHPNNIDKNKIESFTFTFRSSVEHYYPQHPIEGIEPLKAEVLDNFGNLCLISSEKNSRLSNLTPAAKKDYYKNLKSLDSIKQHIMMSYEDWNEEEINDHSREMKQILLDSISGI